MPTLQGQGTALNDRVTDEWRFDMLIIDEAQDFEAQWFEAARLFLNKAPDILWLEDPNQILRSTSLTALLLTFQ